MCILRRIEPVRASYDGSSFLLESAADVSAGDVLKVMSCSEENFDYPGEIIVAGRDNMTFTASGDAFSGLASGSTAVFGCITGLKDPQSLQWDVADLDGASGRNQMGSFFRDRIASKRTISCTWSALDDKEMSDLLRMMEDVFFTLEYPDALTGERKLGEFYVGNRTTPMLKQKDDGTYMWQSLSATFTER